MANEEDEPDAIKSASKWSKVADKRKKHGHIFILSTCLLVALCLFLLPNQKPTSVQKSEQSQVNNDYRASLNENLAQLKAMQTEKTEKQIPNKDIHLLTINASFPKEVLARRNAPTSMYSNPLLENTSESEINSSSDETAVIEAQMIAHPEFTIASGEFLQAVLETAIHSDLPGKIRAVVSRPVYAYTGERSLIPSGSRLMGHYSSAILQGQNRVMIIWDRIILPDGMTVQLNSSSMDDLGRAGLSADSLNRHFFARFSTSALLSVIGVGTATAGVNNQDQYNSAVQYRTAMAQSFQQSAQQSLQGRQAIEATLHIQQGRDINVFVAQDISFYQALKNKMVKDT